MFWCQLLFETSPYYCVDEETECLSTRGWLSAIFASWTHPRITLVPQADDAKLLWDLWVEQNKAEGILLKKRSSQYHVGKRSEEWLKWKCFAGTMRLYARIDAIEAGELWRVKPEWHPDRATGKKAAN
jgi:ATP dependent DNA ligase domain